MKSALLFALAAFSTGKLWAQPTITTQPVSQTVDIGATVTFSVSATSSGRISYQWQFFGTPIGSATNATLTLIDIGSPQAGSFTVVVTDASGSVTSNPATLTVIAPTYSVTTFASLAGWSVANGLPPGPNGLAVDSSGDVFVTIGNAVAKVTSSGNVSVIAGNPSAPGASSDGTGNAARFNSPAGIAVDNFGNIYVADSGNNAIRKIAASGAVTTLAGLVQGNADGVGVAAEFSGPTAVALDSSGNVYVADAGNNELRKVSPTGTTTTLLSGNSPSLAGALGFVPAVLQNYPLVQGPTYIIRGVAVDENGIPYVVGAYTAYYYYKNDPIDRGDWISSHSIYVLEVTAAGSCVSEFSLPNTGPLAIDGSGNLYAFTGDSFYVGNLTNSNPIPIGGTGSAIALPVFAQESQVVAIAAASGGSFLLANPATQSIIQVTPVGNVPSIDVQPVGATIPYGVSTTLSVVASGSPPPTFQWQVDGVNIAGTTSPTYVTFMPGTYSVVVTNSAGSVTSSPAVVKAATRLVNISSRAFVGTDANLEIAGFVIAGPPGTTEQVLIRGAGPALSQFGVGGTLTKPVLSLFDSSGNQLATNTGWNSAANAAAIASAEITTGAFQFPLDGSDSAILVSLPPGIYTAEITGLNGATGVALAEIYEVNSGAPELINISTRAYVGPGSNVEIGGFVITGSQSAKVLIRAIGPTLGEFGLNGVLAQPSLSVVNSSGNMVASNTGWSTNSNAAAIASEMAACGAFALPSGSADCALLLTLPPGAYTAVVSGVNGTSGVALVEVYQAP